jgi:MFS family permease
MKSLSVLRLFAISSFGFATTLFANVLDPALYGHKILQLSPDNPSTLLGFTTAAGSILVILVAPIVGALSDKNGSRFGRRLPYFLAGMPLMIFAMFAIGFAPSILIFVFGVLLYRFGDNLIFTPFQALYPDMVPAKQRGLASGIKSLIDILAVLTGRVVAGELMSHVPEWGNNAVLIAVAIPCVVLLVAYIITWRAVRGMPRVKVEPHQGSIWKIYRESFRFDPRARKDFVWWLLNRFLFWTAFILLSTFLLLFVIYVIGLP